MVDLIGDPFKDRICWLAGEENALGRFLKEHGKNDRTRAGKMMIGRTMVVSATLGWW